jgi:sugar O-acyltransferase (sialic acid O-acetyltransferase NeuD family)
MIKSKILVPLLNANEPEARLVAIHVREGQVVEKGTVLFTIETTKATSDIEASETGFIRILAEQGEIVALGSVLGMITGTADEEIGLADVHPRPLTDVPLATVSASGAGSGANPALPGNLRITKPALALANSLGLDLSRFPPDRLVTEKMVRQLAGIAIPFALPASDKPYLMIFGAGGHAKSVLEMVLQNNNFTITGILDDDPGLTGHSVLGIPVLGTRSMLSILGTQGVHLAANGVGGILDISVRIKIFELLSGFGFSFPAIVHPRATIEPSARVEEGVQVFANSYVGSEAKLKTGCMVNTNAVISHDCVIGEYTHIAPGALLAGHVHVGARTLVGMGVTTAIAVQIGDGVRIGNGAIILADVPDKTIIQAGRFWTGKAGSA